MAGGLTFVNRWALVVRVLLLLITLVCTSRTLHNCVRRRGVPNFLLPLRPTGTKLCHCKAFLQYSAVRMKIQESETATSPSDRCSRATADFTQSQHRS